jgi:hypothetical protein
MIEKEIKNLVQDNPVQAPTLRGRSLDPYLPSKQERLDSMIAWNAAHRRTTLWERLPWGG